MGAQLDEDHDVVDVRSNSDSPENPLDDPAVASSVVQQFQRRFRNLLKEAAGSPILFVEEVQRPASSVSNIPLPKAFASRFIKVIHVDVSAVEDCGDDSAWELYSRRLRSTGRAVWRVFQQLHRQPDPGVDIGALLARRRVFVGFCGSGKTSIAKLLAGLCVNREDALGLLSGAESEDECRRSSGCCLRDFERALQTLEKFQLRALENFRKLIAHVNGCVPLNTPFIVEDRKLQNFRARRVCDKRAIISVVLPLWTKVFLRFLRPCVVLSEDPSSPQSAVVCLRLVVGSFFHQVKQTWLRRRDLKSRWYKERRHRIHGLTEKYMLRRPVGRIARHLRQIVLNGLGSLSRRGNFLCSSVSSRNRAFVRGLPSQYYWHSAQSSLLPWFGTELTPR